jgi:hypothetical protein
MMRKFVGVGAIVGLLTLPAAAQSNLSVPINPRDVPPTQEQIDRQKATDRAYDAAIQKIPDKKSSTDPWGNIRPTSPAAAKNKQ